MKLCIRALKEVKEAVQKGRYFKVASMIDKCSQEIGRQTLALKEQIMKPGDRVIWTCRHHFNSKSSRSKEGKYYGLIRHTVRYSGPQLAFGW